jgi:dipeptidyl aminopeptidase/acylaminoacyl peptidase
MKLGSILQAMAIGCLALSVSPTAHTAAPGAGPPPAAAFGRLPAITQAGLSPNGKWLVRDRVGDDSRSIEIWDLESGKLRRSIGIDPTNRLHGLGWTSDATIYFQISAAVDLRCRETRDCRYEIFETRAADTEGGDTRALLAAGQYQWTNATQMLAPITSRANIVMMDSLDMAIAPRADSAKTARTREREATRRPRAVFAVDTRSGSGDIVTTGTADTVDWVLDARSDPVARGEWLVDAKQFSVLVRDGKSWNRVFQASGSRLNLAGLTMDGNDIVAVGTNSTERTRAWAIPLDGKPIRLLYEDPKGDVVGASVTEYGHGVVGLWIRSDDGLLSAHWLDKERGSRYRSLKSAFSGRLVVDRSESADGRRATVTVDGASKPREFRLVDFEKSKADLIGEQYPELARAPLGEARTIRYTSRDGRSIPAILTVPPGIEARDIPLVVMPHDWGYVDDGQAFDWFAQFLATRGYAVLQPQYRGSVGFGHAHEQAGVRQWGGLAQNDITDGVRHLVADGTADPRRICIVGLGFGGYSALWGATFAADTYACAASIGGYSDLPVFVSGIRRSSGTESKYAEYWTDQIGRPEAPELAAWSPARHAASVKVPVLLMHGTNDLDVPINQSEMMERALESAGKVVTFVKLPAGDHQLSLATTRTQVLTEVEKFLADHLH